MSEYGNQQRDVSMMDVTAQVDDPNTASHNNATPTDVNEEVSRRKSSLILTEDANQVLSESGKSENNSFGYDQPPGEPPVLIPTTFRWTEGGEKVFVMGTFTGWRKMIALSGPSPKDGSFQVQISLPPGTHRFKFVVDNEVKCSNFIPTATDHSGHFVNYLEIFSTEYDLARDVNSKSRSSLRTMDSKLGLTKDDDDMGDGYTRYYDDQEGSAASTTEYITSIPSIFTDPKVMEEYYLTLDNNERKGNYTQQWLIPPQLPPHLENVILNSYNSNDKANTGGALSIPNHVVLNHLATTSIKHNTLAVASVVRYKRKYVTQILYAPLQ